MPTSNIEEFAAPYLLGAVWNWCLYGALVVQFYVYSYNFKFPRDNKYIKSLVYVIFFLETVQTVVSGYSLYDWFAADFGNDQRLDASSFYQFEALITGSVVSPSVQLYFVYQILMLSEKRLWWLCVIICPVSIVGASGAFVSGVFQSLASPRNNFNPVVSNMVFDMALYGGLVGTMLSDLLIASAMLYLMRRIWARDGELSNHAFVSMVRIMVESNLVTTIVGIVTLLMVSLYPDENWFVCPLMILGKLHSNTLLVSVNNRILIPDSCKARGAAADREVVTARPGVATK